MKGVVQTGGSRERPTSSQPAHDRAEVHECCCEDRPSFPLPLLLSRRLMLITVRGRRTDRLHTLTLHGRTVQATGELLGWDSTSEESAAGTGPPRRGKGGRRGAHRHGHPGLSDWDRLLVGSVAPKVVHFFADLPVLIRAVRPEAASYRSNPVQSGAIRGWSEASSRPPARSWARATAATTSSRVRIPTTWCSWSMTGTRFTPPSHMTTAAAATDWSASTVRARLVMTSPTRPSLSVPARARSEAMAPTSRPRGAAHRPL